MCLMVFDVRDVLNVSDVFVCLVCVFDDRV